MTNVVNTPITGRFLHLNSSGFPLTGLTGASYIEALATLTDETGAVATTVTITITEQSGGWYGYSYTPTAAGVWVESVIYNAVTPSRRWAGSERVEDVIATGDPDAIAAAILSQPATGDQGTIGGTLSRISGGGMAIINTQPVDGNGDVTIIRGDDYNATDSRALDWSTTDSVTWPDLTGASVTLTAYYAPTNQTITKAGSVVTPTGATKKVRVELAAADTAGKTAGKLGVVYDFDVQATLASGRKVTLVTGNLLLKADVTT